MVNFEIAFNDLKYIFDSLKPAILNNSSRPIYEFINFKCSGDKASAYATDGYRAHSVTVPIKSDSEPFEFLIRPFQLPKSGMDVIPCELDKRWITLDFGSRKFVEKLGEGDFVDCESVVPKLEPIAKIGLNAKYLMDAAKTLHGKDDARNPIVIEIYNPLVPAMIYKQKDPSDYRMVLPMRLKE